MEVKMCDICCEPTSSIDKEDDSTSAGELTLFPGSNGSKILDANLRAYFVVNKLLKCSKENSLSLLTWLGSNGRRRGGEGELLFSFCTRCDKTVNKTLELHCEIVGLQNKINELGKSLRGCVQVCQRRENDHVTDSIAHKLRAFLDPTDDRKSVAFRNANVKQEINCEDSFEDEDATYLEDSLDFEDFDSSDVNFKEESPDIELQSKEAKAMQRKKNHNIEPESEAQLEENIVSLEKGSNAKTKNKTYYVCSNGNYGCKLCESTYTTYPGIAKHDRMHRESNSLGNEYDCTICRHPTLSDSKLRRHMTKIHGIQKQKGNLQQHKSRSNDAKNSYNRDSGSNDANNSNNSYNPETAKSIQNEASLKSPRKVGANSLDESVRTETYACKLCESVYTTMPGVKKHMRAHRQSKLLGNKYDCPTCRHPTVSESNLRRHITAVHQNKISCKEPDEISVNPKIESYQTSPLSNETNLDSSGDVIHKRIGSGSTISETRCQEASLDGNFNCKLCESVYASIMGFRKHKRMHHESDLLGKKYDCPICRHPTTSVKNLKVHLAIGHQNKVSAKYYEELTTKFPDMDTERLQIFDPSDTSKNTAAANKMITISENHCYVQSYDGNFRCKRCDSVYISFMGIKRHERMHEKSDVLGNVFDCSLCGHPTTTEKNLRIHISTVHQKRILPSSIKVSKNLPNTDENILQIYETSDKLLPISSESVTIDTLETETKATTLESERKSYCQSTTNGNFICKLCDTTTVYTTYPGIVKHGRMHKESNLLGNVYDCTICRHPNLSDGKLRRHMTKVHGIQQKKVKKVCNKINDESTKLPENCNSEDDTNISQNRRRRKNRIVNSVPKDGHSSSEEEGTQIEGQSDDEDWTPFHDEKETTYNRRSSNDNFEKLTQRQPENTQDELFLCDKCNVGYKSARGYRRHEAEHQASISLDHKYDCHCGFPASSERRLRYHKKRMHFDALTCLMCDYRASTLALLKAHMRNHSKLITRRHKGRTRRVRSTTWRIGGKVQCKKCEASYWCPRAFKKHINDHEESKLINGVWDCGTCRFPCINEKQLERHRYLKHQSRKVKCSICQKTFANAGLLKAHMRIHEECDKAQDPSTGLFCCALCSFMGRTSRGLLSHKSVYHRDAGLYSSGECQLCPECGKRFYTAALLRKHVKNIHENVYTYTCEQCGKGFDSKPSFNNHRSTHENIHTKQYICDLCAAAYSHKRSLLTHVLKYHSEVKNIPASGRNERRFPTAKDYKCKWCPTVFPFKYMLLSHMSTSHQDRYSYSCDECDKKYTSGSSLRLHKEIAHSGGSHTYFCKYCRKSFAHRQYVTCHYKFCSAKRASDQAASVASAPTTTDNGGN